MEHSRNFFTKVSDFFGRQKRYVALLSGSLPVDSRNWGPEAFLGALETSLYTNRAIAKRADKVGEIEWRLEDKAGKEIDDPVLDLLYKPNAVFTGRQFWSLWCTYYDTVGETYILLERNRDLFETEGKVTGMHMLIPTRVKPVFGENGKPKHYEYRTDKATITYQPEQIVYINNPDPKKPLRGRSILRPGISAIQTEMQISTYHARILENGGKVEGVFNFGTKSGLNGTQLREIKDRYQKEYGEAKKAGLPLFMGGDAKYERTGLSPEELGFLEAKRMTLEDICILTGVPKSMLASTNDVKFDNADADRAIFLRETIRPLLVTLTTALDQALFPDDRLLTFVDPTPENADRKRQDVEAGVKNSYMTINEARHEYDMDPIDGGDVPLVPFNMIPLESAGEAQASEKRLKGVQEHPLRDEGMRRLWEGMQIKRADAREKRVERVVKKYFDEQSERLVEVLQPATTRVFRKQGLLEESLKIELEVKLGKKMLLPVLEEMLKAAGADAMEFAGSEFPFNITADIKSWLDNHAEVFLTSINETTFKKLKDQFAESLAAGEGREALISRIERTYGNIKKSRAALIARTETHNAMQFGTMEGYKQAGFKTKIWVAVMDSATRDSHVAVDGEERPMDAAFSNGLMFPGDPAGPPEEVINCRCVI